MTLPSSLTLEHVGSGGSDGAGENIHVDLIVDGGNQLRLDIPYHRITIIMQAIREAAAMAVQLQQLQPGDGRKIVSTPYVAVDATVGLFPSTERTAIQFQTAEGIPLVVAMSRELTVRTIEQLQEVLAYPPEPPRVS